MPIRDIKKRIRDLYTFSLASRLYTYLKVCILPFREFSTYLPGSGFFLDFGTGFGYMANFIHLESGDRKVVGVDIDQKRIDVAKKTTTGRKNIDFRCGDIRHMSDIKDADVITMADVLHHIPREDQEDYLRCIHAKLKADGLFILRETNKKNTLKYFLMNYFAEVILYPFSEKCQFFSAASLKDVLQKVGFQVIDEIPSSPWFIYETIIYVCKK